MSSKAGIYIRLSKLREDDRTLSPETQLARCEDLADAKGLDVILTEQDLDESAYNQPWNKRPSFVKLVEAVKRKEISTIIVARLDRFARRVRDTIDVVEILEQHGGRLVAGDTDVDVSTAQGRFNLNLIASLAELEVGRLSERVKAGHRTRATKLQGTAGTPPMWLSYDKESKTYSIKEEIAEAFRLMVTMRSQGRGFTAITRALNEGGFTKSTGAPWKMADVFRYLQDNWIDSMTGAQFYNRPSQRKYKNGKEIKKGETIKIPDVYPVIINEDLANKAKEVNKRNKQTGGKNTGEAYLLNGLLICKQCGGKLKGSSVGHSRFYMCENIGHPNHLKNFNVASNMVEDAVIRATKFYLESKARHLPKVAKPDAKQIAKIQRSLELRLVRLNDMYELGTINRENYLQKVEEIKVEQKTLEVQEEETPNELPELPEDVSSLPKATLRDLLRLTNLVAEYPFYDDRITSANGSLRPMVKISYATRSRLRTGAGSTKGDIELYAPVYRAGWSQAKQVLTDDELYGD